MTKGELTLAARTNHLEPEGAYQVLARAQELEKAGRDIIHLEIGQPDFQTFPRISLSGIRAISQGETRYTPSSGINRLREAAARYTSQRTGVSYTAAQAVIGPGAKPLLFFPMMALLEAGDQVLYPDPGFPSYRAIIQTMGAEPVPIPLNEATGFSLDMNEFSRKVGEKTRMIILNSPSNPTGGIVEQEDIEIIARAADRWNFWILSDDIYSRLYYGDSPLAGIAALPGMSDRTIVMDGFSKTYAMTGWRLGYALMPEPLADTVGLLLTHSVGCTASFTQIAGAEALEGPQDEVETVRSIFKRRRDGVVKALNRIPGVTCQTPRGAFYVFPNISAFGRSSRETADYLLDSAGVAVLPGTSFGSFGEGYLRLCYANSMENIERAVDRMADALSAWK